MDPAADHADAKKPDVDRSVDYAPYPTLTAEDVAPPPPPSAAVGPRDITSLPPEHNPYVTSSPAPKSMCPLVYWDHESLLFDPLILLLFGGRYDGYGAGCAREVWEEGQ